MTDKFKPGRLKSLGIESEKQVALYLPDSYLDLRNVIKTHSEAHNASMSGYEIVIQGVLNNEPVINYAPGKQPRLEINLALSGGGTIGFSVFDTDKALKTLIESLNEQTAQPITVSGIPLLMGSKLKLNKAEIVPSQFAGRILPVYKGKTKIVKPETVRNLVLARLSSSIPLATEHLKKLLVGADVSKIVDISKLEMILNEVHLPTSMKHADRANEVLNLIAAKVSQNKIMSHYRPDDNWEVSSRINISSRWPQIAQLVDFELTGEQVGVIQDIANSLNKAVPMRGMLQGDVGSGKTVCFSIPAISAALEGKNVALLIPNSSLAYQVYNEVCQWIPKESGLEPIFISGSSKKGVGESTSSSGKLFIGTTALLFRELGKIDFFIIDEQQKFSNEQRRQLVSEGTHLLEASATPIPRSVALVKYGAMQVWRLNTNHTKKDIDSKLFTDRQSGKEIIRLVNHTLSVGNQGIIVYSLKEESEAEGMSDLMSAEQAYEKWNKMYPGLVRLVHSKMSEDDKNAALNDMKEERAKLLISTTVIEVGVTIPGVMLLAVINAERFGLTTLHQLRGRLARHGNKNGQRGEFLMLTKENPSMKTIERLNVMLETNDGYVIAEKDVRLRGFGDLHLESESQSGADNSVFIGRKIDIDLMEAVL
ncbi:ATP-dependent DNA helicase RecG [Thiomicrorhabdus hydrogeniphila]